MKLAKLSQEKGSDKYIGKKVYIEDLVGRKDWSQSDGRQRCSLLICGKKCAINLAFLLHRSASQ